MSTNFLRATAKSHGQKVCNLYKRSLREIQANITLRHNRIIEIRFDQVLMRARFEENKHLQPHEARQALADGEKEIALARNPWPLCFGNSPGGNAYGTMPPDPDWILDTWHPLEKAQYPEYFARRDVRKREFLERQENKMIEYKKEHAELEKKVNDHY